MSKKKKISVILNNRQQDDLEGQSSDTSVSRSNSQTDSDSDSGKYSSGRSSPSISSEEGTSSGTPPEKAGVQYSEEHKRQHSKDSIIHSYNHYDGYRARFGEDPIPVTKAEEELAEWVWKELFENYELQHNKDKKQKVIRLDFGSYDRERQGYLYQRQAWDALKNGKAQKITEIAYDVANKPLEVASASLKKQHKVLKGAPKYNNQDYSQKWQNLVKPLNRFGQFHAKRSKTTGDGYGVEKGEGFSRRDKYPLVPTYHAKTLVNEQHTYGVKFVIAQPENGRAYLEQFFGRKRVDILANNFGPLAHIPTRKDRMETVKTWGKITQGIVYGTFPGEGGFREHREYFEKLRENNKGYKFATEERDIYYHKALEDIEIVLADGPLTVKKGETVPVKVLEEMLQTEEFNKLINDGKLIEMYYHIFNVEELREIQKEIQAGMAEANPFTASLIDPRTIAPQPPIAISTIKHPSELVKNREEDNKDYDLVKSGKAPLGNAWYLAMVVKNPYTRKEQAVGGNLVNLMNSNPSKHPSNERY
ncbi:MAG: hypothetical protein K0R63_1465 [Rickettsiales bacterium]|jgi:hypothetical protein|nr:hypothetical protein [Rickettsiales bacterium]